MAQYTLENGFPGVGTIITDNRILRHLLIIGSQANDSRATLRTLARQQLDMGRSLVTLDVDGGLSELARSHWITQCGTQERADVASVLMDTGKQSVFCFNPFDGQPSEPAAQEGWLFNTLQSGARREGLLAVEQDLLQACANLESLVRLITIPESYFHRSLSARNAFANVEQFLQEPRHVFSTVRPERQSVIYGQFLANWLYATASCASRQEPLLILIDDLWHFAGPSFARFAEQLTDRRVGVVMACTYADLERLRLRDPGFYEKLLYLVETVLPLDASRDDPDEVICDVSERLWGHR